MSSDMEKRTFGGFATLETYSHVIGVDVIRAHDVGISVFQDDPGVVDFEWRGEFMGRRT